ncbi:proline-rich protein 15 [Pungitius pungitius]|uniref:proline-rich protein 15 n=1 Tax=Pungitius pungitius TaxID=134920 RepID=UPI001886BA20|nr:proline-rich protein 15 [Pungitius pungitius]
MTERAPWWKAFLPKKKSAGSRETSSSNAFDADFDPFGQHAERQKDQSLSEQESNKSSSIGSEDTYDDSRLESVFNEQTCRRNMKVSRSGRFKEKRRVRSTLPIEDKETEDMR